MALTDCPECAGKVSTKAAACPHCGAPVEGEEVRAQDGLPGDDPEGTNGDREDESELTTPRPSFVRSRDTRILDDSTERIRARGADCRDRETPGVVATSARAQSWEGAYHGLGLLRGGLLALLLALICAAPFVFAAELGQGRFRTGTTTLLVLLQAVSALAYLVGFILVLVGCWMCSSGSGCRALTVRAMLCWCSTLPLMVTGAVFLLITRTLEAAIWAAIMICAANLLFLATLATVSKIVELAAAASDERPLAHRARSYRSLAAAGAIVVVLLQLLLFALPFFGGSAAASVVFKLLALFAFIYLVKALAGLCASGSRAVWNARRRAARHD